MCAGAQGLSWCLRRVIENSHDFCLAELLRGKLNYTTQMLSIQYQGGEAKNPISVLHLHVWLPRTVLECCVSMCNFCPLKECLVEGECCWWCLWHSSWCDCLAAVLISDVILINVISISVELYCLSTSYMHHLNSTFAWGFLTDVMPQPTKMAEILEKEYIPAHQGNLKKVYPHTCCLVTLRSGWGQTFERH